MTEAADEIAMFWRLLVGVMAVYVVLFFVVTQGFAFSLSSSSIRDQITESIGSDAGLLEHGVLLLSNVLTRNSLIAQDTATALLQIILTILAFLAVTWSLRRVRDLKAVRVRDAYYEGTGSFVAFSLATLVFTIMMIPMSWGSSLLTSAAEFAPSRIELFAVIAISLLLAGLSLYWLLCTWPALFIVSLPGMPPLRAINKARLLSKGRRWQVLVRLAGFGLLMTLLFMIILFGVAVLVPAAVIGVLVILSLALFLYSTVFMYMTYRSLL